MRSLCTLLVLLGVLASIHVCYAQPNLPITEDFTAGPVTFFTVGQLPAVQQAGSSLCSASSTTQGAGLYGQHFPHPIHVKTIVDITQTGGGSFQQAHYHIFQTSNQAVFQVGFRAVGLQATFEFSVTAPSAIATTLSTYTISHGTGTYTMSSRIYGDMVEGTLYSPSGSSVASYSHTFDLSGASLARYGVLTHPNNCIERLEFLSVCSSGNSQSYAPQCVRPYDHDGKQYAGCTGLSHNECLANPACVAEAHTRCAGTADDETCSASSPVCDGGSNCFGLGDASGTCTTYPCEFHSSSRCECDNAFAPWLPSPTVSACQWQENFVCVARCDKFNNDLSGCTTAGCDWKICLDNCSAITDEDACRGALSGVGCAWDHGSGEESYCTYPPWRLEAIAESCPFDDVTGDTSPCMAAECRDLVREQDYMRHSDEDAYIDSACTAIVRSFCSINPSDGGCDAHVIRNTSLSDGCISNGDMMALGGVCVQDRLYEGLDNHCDACSDLTPEQCDAQSICTGEHIRRCEYNVTNDVPCYVWGSNETACLERDCVYDSQRSSCSYPQCHSWGEDHETCTRNPWCTWRDESVCRVACGNIGDRTTCERDAGNCKWHECSAKETTCRNIGFKFDCVNVAGCMWEGYATGCVCTPYNPHCEDPCPFSKEDPLSPCNFDEAACVNNRRLTITPSCANYTCNVYCLSSGVDDPGCSDPEFLSLCDEWRSDPDNGLCSERPDGAPAYYSGKCAHAFDDLNPSVYDEGCFQYRHNRSACLDNDLDHSCNFRSEHECREFNQERPNCEQYSGEGEQACRNVRGCYHDTNNGGCYAASNCHDYRHDQCGCIQRGCEWQRETYCFPRCDLLQEYACASIDGCMWAGCLRTDCHTATDERTCSRNATYFGCDWHDQDGGEPTCVRDRDYHTNSTDREDECPFERDLPESPCNADVCGGDGDDDGEDSFLSAACAASVIAYCDTHNPSDPGCSHTAIQAILANGENPFCFSSGVPYEVVPDGGVCGERHWSETECSPCRNQSINTQSECISAGIECKWQSREECIVPDAVQDICDAAGSNFDSCPGECLWDPMHNYCRSRDCWSIDDVSQCIGQSGCTWGLRTECEHRCEDIFDSLTCNEKPACQWHRCLATDATCTALGVDDDCNRVSGCVWKDWDGSNRCECTHWNPLCSDEGCPFQDHAQSPCSSEACEDADDGLSVACMRQVCAVYCPLVPSDPACSNILITSLCDSFEETGLPQCWRDDLSEPREVFVGACERRSNLYNGNDICDEHSDNRTACLGDGCRWRYEAQCAASNDPAFAEICESYRNAAICGEDSRCWWTARTSCETFCGADDDDPVACGARASCSYVGCVPESCALYASEESCGFIVGCLWGGPSGCIVDPHRFDGGECPIRNQTACRVAFDIMRRTQDEQSSTALWQFAVRHCVLVDPSDPACTEFRFQYPDASCEALAQSALAVCPFSFESSNDLSLGSGLVTSLQCSSDCSAAFVPYFETCLQNHPDRRRVLGSFFDRARLLFGDCLLSESMMNFYPAVGTPEGSACRDMDGIPADGSYPPPAGSADMGGVFPVCGFPAPFAFLGRVCDSACARLFNSYYDCLSAVPQDHEGYYALQEFRARCEAVPPVNPLPVIFDNRTRALSPSSIRVLWTPRCRYPNPSRCLDLPIMGYTVRVNQLFGNITVGIPQVFELGPAEQRIDLNGLVGSTFYSIEIIAHNLIGSSQPPAQRLFRTLDPPSPAPPAGPRFDVKGSRFLTIHWSRPDNAPNLVGYIVFRRVPVPGTVGEYIVAEVGRVASPSVTMFNLTGLQPAAMYHISIASVDVFDPLQLGLQTEYICTTTRAEQPPRPFSPMIHDIQATWAMVSDVPAGSESGAHYTGYDNLAESVELFIYPLDDGVSSPNRMNVTIAWLGGTQVHSHNFTGLSGNTVYAARARVHILDETRRLASPWSAESVFSTLGYVPGSPRSAQAEASSHSVAVSWSPPTDDGGAPVRYYAVIIWELDAAGGQELGILAFRQVVADVSLTIVSFRDDDSDDDSIDDSALIRFFRVQVFAVNGVGMGLGSTPVDVQSLPPPPRIASYVASDPDPQVTGVSVGDILTLTFTRDTLMPSVSLMDHVLFDPLIVGTTISPSWRDARTLVFTIDAVDGGSSPFTVGASQVILRPALVNALTAVSYMDFYVYSPKLTGSFGASVAYFDRGNGGDTPSLAEDTGVLRVSQVCPLIGSALDPAVDYAIEVGAVSQKIDFLGPVDSVFWPGIFYGNGTAVAALFASSGVRALVYTGRANHFHGIDHILCKLSVASDVVDVMVVRVHVVAVNDAPTFVNQVALSQTATFDAWEVVGNLQVADVDSVLHENAAILVVLRVQPGNLVGFSGSARGGVQYLPRFANPGYVVGVQGLLSDVNAALSNFRVNFRSFGSHRLVVAVNDLGNGNPPGVTTSLVAVKEISFSVTCGAGTVAPALQSAVLGSNLQSIAVHFDRGADIQEMQRNCSHWWSSATVAKLGAAPLCFFAPSSSNSNLTMFIALGYRATIDVGDDLELKPSTLRRCVGSTLYASGSVSLESPAIPPRPTVLIAAPSTVASCDNFIVRAVVTSGLGGRPAALYSWYASGDILDGLSTSGEFVEIPASAIAAGSNYTIGVTVTNFLDMESVPVSTIVFVMPGAAPRIIINSPSPRVISRSSYYVYPPYCGGSPSQQPYRRLGLVSRMTVSSCTSLSTLEIAYNWTVDRVTCDAAHTYVSGLSLSDGFAGTSSPYVFASIRNLHVNTCYKFAISARMVTGGVSDVATDSVVVHVVPSALLLCFEGGAQRTVPSHDSTILSVHLTDPDETSEAVVWMWVCVDVLSGGGSCVNPLTGVALTFADVSGRFLLGAGMLLPGAYNFSVIATKGTRSAQVMQRLDVIQTPIPLVLIQSRRDVVNAATEIFLFANLDGGAEGFSFSWSQTSGNDLLCAAPVDRQYLAITEDLCLQGAFNPYASDYCFEVSVTRTNDPDGPSAQAAACVVPRVPPSGGSCTVSPSAGTEASTTFTVSAIGWEDSEGSSLWYGFYFLRSDGSRAALAQVRESVSEVQVTLPRGEPLTLVCDVVDKYYARATAQTFVTVSPTDLTIDDILSQIVVQNQDASDSEDTEEALRWFLAADLVMRHVIASLRAEGNDTTALETEAETARREMIEGLVEATVLRPDSAALAVTTLSQLTEIDEDRTADPDLLNAAIDLLRDANAQVSNSSAAHDDSVNADDYWSDFFRCINNMFEAIEGELFGVPKAGPMGRRLLLLSDAEVRSSVVDLWILVQDGFIAYSLYFGMNIGETVLLTGTAFSSLSSGSVSRRLVSEGMPTTVAGSVKFRIDAGVLGDMLDDGDGEAVDYYVGVQETNLFTYDLPPKPVIIGPAVYVGVYKVSTAALHTDSLSLNRYVHLDIPFTPELCTADAGGCFPRCAYRPFVVENDPARWNQWTYLQSYESPEGAEFRRCRVSRPGFVTLIDVVDFPSSTGAPDPYAGENGGTALASPSGAVRIALDLSSLFSLTANPIYVTAFLERLRDDLVAIMNVTLSQVDFRAVSQVPMGSGTRVTFDILDGTVGADVSAAALVECILLPESFCFAQNETSAAIGAAYVCGSALQSTPCSSGSSSPSSSDSNVAMIVIAIVGFMILVAFVYFLVQMRNGSGARAGKMKGSRTQVTPETVPTNAAS